MRIGNEEFDVWGDTDPRKMPPHFFHSVVRLDYETAVRADFKKQYFSTCPRHWYIDATFQCSRCKTDFLFPATEQKFWYETLRFYVDVFPRACPRCREAIRRFKAMEKKYASDIAATLRKAAGTQAKEEMLGIIDALLEERGALPEHMLRNRRVLESQLAKRAG